MTCEVAPEIVEAFRPQFEACEALLDFAKEHRPAGPPTPDPAGQMILRTYARSSKTYQASLLLSLRGYGVQAGMLNRSLFEDMLVAHWIKRNPDEAPIRYERHRQHIVEQMREGITKRSRAEELELLPPLSEDERMAFEKEFGNRHWTQMSLYDLAKEVDEEWAEGKFGREMLWWVFDIAHRFNNLLLHHSAFGLGLAAEDDLEAGTVRFDVGPSLAHIHGALFVAFFSYTNTMSLVLTGEDAGALQRLFDEHMKAFLTFRDRD